MPQAAKSNEPGPPLRIGLSYRGSIFGRSSGPLKSFHKDTRVQSPFLHLGHGCFGYRVQNAVTRAWQCLHSKNLQARIKHEAVCTGRQWQM